MKNVLTFLSDLERNNNREWFAKNKASYEAANKSVIGLTEQVLNALPAFDASIHGLTAKDCLFRIYRDVRFSTNKAPYKNNMGAWIAPGGRKSPSAGYYVHIQPGESFVAAGVWMPEAPVLNAIRQEIHFNHAAFNTIVNGQLFKKKFPVLEGEVLKSAPKGFEKDHPAIELLKHKSFIVSTRLNDKAVLGKDLEKQIVESFRTAYPMVRFLNEAIQLSKPV